MAYTPYTPVSISGYNNSAPPDDGSTGSNNLISWSGIKTNLTDPLDTAVASLNTNLITAFGLRAFRAKSTQSSDYTAVLADYGKILACSSSPTITLPDAATVGEGWHISIVNAGTGKILIDGNGSQTINGANVVELSNLHDNGVFMSDGSNFVGFVNRSVGRTGDFKYVSDGTTAPNGTLRLTGETIGDLSSSATYKGEIYRALFNILKLSWGNLGTENFDSHNSVTLPTGRDKLSIGGGNTYTFGSTGGSRTISQGNLPNVNWTSTLSVSKNTLDTNLSSVGTGLDTGTVGTASGANQAIQDVSLSKSSITLVGGPSLSGNVSSGGSGTAYDQPWFGGFWVVVY